MAGKKTSAFNPFSGNFFTAKFLCFWGLILSLAPLEAQAQGQPIFNATSSTTMETYGPVSLPFTITLSHPATNVVSVQFFTSQTRPFSSYQAHAFANMDYIPTNGTLTFPIGSTSQTFTVTTIGNQLQEYRSKDFFVIYTNPINASFDSFEPTDPLVTQGYIIEDDTNNVLPGFTITPLIQGLNWPSRMEFAPDGRLFICEQNDDIRVVVAGQLLPTPFLLLSADSEDYGEAGILGLAFDPAFTNNGNIFVYYSALYHTPDGGAAGYNRVSRFSGSGNVYTTNSEHIIFSPTNIASTQIHNGGDLHFGPDGKLYLGTGDAGNSTNAPSLSCLQGKILRFNADGSIPTDNPFYNSTTNLNRAIWAKGLRNPFTFAFQPGSGRMFINDVGLSSFEEINLGLAGKDYGWPAAEGIANTTNYANPYYCYPHHLDLEDYCTGAITGGTFYNPVTNRFRAQDLGCYFFCDYCMGVIQKINPTNNLPPTKFATQILSPVDLKVGPDGCLYCLSRGAGYEQGTVYRIQYSSPSISANGVCIPTNNTFVLAWASEVGEKYQPQSKDRLTNSTWLDLGPVLTASMPQTLVTNATSGSTKFYRIKKL